MRDLLRKLQLLAIDAAATAELPIAAYPRIFMLSMQSMPLAIVRRRPLRVGLDAQTPDATEPHPFRAARLCVVRECPGSASDDLGPA